MIGEIINGFTVKAKIGEGGMGIVYLAENDIGLKVAVKILKPEFAKDTGMCRRFRRECETMVRLQGHPNVAQIYSVADCNDVPVLMMEYLDGGMDLNAYIEKNGAVQDETLLKNWLLQILKVLNYAHSLSPKIIHRDIKPSNLYLTKFGDIKLLDFGIVKVLEESTNPELTLRTFTTTTSKMGSVSFMSPEQSFDPKLVDERSDIYSLGKTFETLMTAGDPFVSISFEPFKTIIEKSILKNPNDRFQNCEEILDLLTENFIIQPISISPIDDIKVQPKSVNCEIPGEMVLVVGGTFEMGSYHADEAPPHEVTLESFYIGRFPVTQKLWREVMGCNPKYFDGDNLPVYNVSWLDCIIFCNAFSRKAGFEECYQIERGVRVTLLDNKRGFRLPSEAEWEYAARGGNRSQGYTYAGSDCIDSVAWYYENSDGKLHSVGEKAPNELGIYDMSGNVLEWCWEQYYKYQDTPQINPIGSVHNSSAFNHICRGGCVSNYSWRTRVTFRNTIEGYRGFRLTFNI